MKPFCEIVVFEVLPAVRAMVARKLTGEYGVSQRRVAALLGVSQPAISQYKRDMRGYRSELFKKNPGLRTMVDQIAEGMASGEIKDFQATLSFCKLCKEIRFSGAGCAVHRERNPSKNACSLCQENQDFYGKPAEGKGAMRKIKKLSRF
jgi:predicted transcriptional regulator